MHCGASGENTQISGVSERTEFFGARLFVVSRTLGTAVGALLLFYNKGCC
jgi:hypothetical protein